MYLRKNKKIPPFEGDHKPHGYTVSRGDPETKRLGMT